MDISEEAFFEKLLAIDDRIDESTDVITFNNVGIALDMIGGENYWETKKVRLYNILVDAPAWYEGAFELGLKCMQVITIDRYHKEFVKKIFLTVR